MTTTDKRAWAREQLRGVAGCLHPTFTGDLSRLNEAAIRHDVEREIELGFAGMLLVGECGTTPAEMRQFIDIAVGAAGGRLVTILQAAEPTLEANIALARYAADAGVDLMLPSYPLTFYPASEEEVYHYTRTLADASPLGVIVFAIHLWNFARLHPSSFSPDLLGRLVRDCPNVVAIKNEIGAPGIAGMAQVFRRFSAAVVVTDPFEMNAPAWTSAYGMQFLGTSNYEYFGGAVPEMFRLLHEPDGFDKAMELYWSMHPARQVNMALMSEAAAGTSLVPRLMWKYQGWLNGFNGGPIRSPQPRLSDRQMTALRHGLRAAGLPVTGDPDAGFFAGRNPR
jgi:dihydrodipicolinate synthase/N-acetylneuraminate lyase